MTSTQESPLFNNCYQTEVTITEAYVLILSLDQKICIVSNDIFSLKPPLCKAKGN